MAASISSGCQPAPDNPKSKQQKIMHTGLKHLTKIMMVVDVLMIMVMMTMKKNDDDHYDDNNDYGGDSRVIGKN